MEQRVSLPDTNFDPSKAFKKNKLAPRISSKEILNEYNANSNLSENVFPIKGSSSKKDFIDQTNLNLPRFSEDLKTSKLSDTCLLYTSPSPRD